VKKRDDKKEKNGKAEDERKTKRKWDKKKKSNERKWKKGQKKRKEKANKREKKRKQDRNGQSNKKSKREKRKKRKAAKKEKRKKKKKGKDSAAPAPTTTTMGPPLPDDELCEAAKCKKSDEACCIRKDGVRLYAKTGGDITKSAIQACLTDSSNNRWCQRDHKIQAPDDGKADATTTTTTDAAQAVSAANSNPATQEEMLAAGFDWKDGCPGKPSGTSFQTGMWCPRTAQLKIAVPISGGKKECEATFTNGDTYAGDSPNNVKLLQNGNTIATATMGATTTAKFTYEKGDTIEIMEEFAIIKLPDGWLKCK